MHLTRCIGTWNCVALQKEKQNGGVKVMWFDDATIYQIYPLGLCGAPLQNDGSDQTGEHRILRVLDWWNI